MIKQENSQLITHLQEHLKNICSLHFGEYGKAEFLYNVTQNIINRHFINHSLYNLSLQKINFATIENQSKFQERDWNYNIEHLLTIVQSMIDDLSQDYYVSHTATSPALSQELMTNQTFLYNKIITGIAFIGMSSWIWFFNKVVSWNWFDQHPKKISIQITCQLLLFILLFLTTKASKKHKETVSIIFAILLGIVALL